MGQAHNGWSDGDVELPSTADIPLGFTDSCFFHLLHDRGAGLGGGCDLWVGRADGVQLSLSSGGDDGGRLLRSLLFCSSVELWGDFMAWIGAVSVTTVQVCL